MTRPITPPHGQVALVGRPNVGKSTLFNRLTGTRGAIVSAVAGTTRDVLGGAVEWQGRVFALVDTGGVIGASLDPMQEAVAERVSRAAATVDLLVFVVDGREGPVPADDEVAETLRRHGVPVVLAVNKTDDRRARDRAFEFHRFGFEPIVEIAAEHGLGIGDLLDEVVSRLPPAPGQAAAITAAHETDAPPAAETRIAVVGRPNVGKSSLVNRLLGEERVVVFDEAGTTRDAIEIPFERNGKPYVLIDTAGIRRRKNVREIAEKFSIIKTLDAIKESHVAVMVLDARSGLVEQDLHLLDYVLTTGRALVLAVNKWDGLESEAKEKMRADIKRRLGFADYAELHFISALHGTAVGDLYPSIERAFNAANAHWSTNRLTTLLQDAVSQ
ncbi:MAG: ribosome biogenesis GTPase Der, partial [Acidobacteria bacterium]|nr:ribosome biogenesis GTPase Der [Acidobacteriota bacterium]